MTFMAFEQCTVFKTGRGRPGIAPSGVEIGDVVSVFAGCWLPYLFRPVLQPEGCYELVGPCYVHGVMDGEGVMKKMSERAECKGPREVFEPIHLV